MKSRTKFLNLSLEKFREREVYLEGNLVSNVHFRFETFFEKLAWIRKAIYKVTLHGGATKGKSTNEHVKLNVLSSSSLVELTFRGKELALNRDRFVE